MNQADTCQSARSRVRRVGTMRIVIRRPRDGWSTAWDHSTWARLERGDRVAARMRAIVRNSLATDLHNAGSNQSNSNFGETVAVAEALLQSHAGEIRLLLALPTGWTDGSVTGLRARGEMEVSMQWRVRTLAPRRSAASPRASAGCDPVRRSSRSRCGRDGR